MKKVLTAILFVLAAAIGRAQQVGTDGGIATSFVAPTGSLCTSGQNTCFTGFTLTYTDPTGKASVIQTCSATVTTNCLTASTGTNYFTFRPGGFLICGTWNFNVVTNWLDNTGKAVQSVPVAASTVEPCPFVPAPVTGITVKPVQ